MSRQDDAVTAPYKHVVRIEAGDYLFSVMPRSEDDNAIEVVAKPLIDAKLKRMSFDSFLKSGSSTEIAQSIDAWILALSEAMVQDVLLSPQPDVVTEIHSKTKIVRDQIVSGRRGVTWLPVTEGGLYLGLSDTENRASNFTPLTPRSWIKWGEPAGVLGHSTLHLLDERTLKLEAF